MAEKEPPIKMFILPEFIERVKALQEQDDRIDIRMEIEKRVYDVAIKACEEDRAYTAKMKLFDLVAESKKAHKALWGYLAEIIPETSEGAWTLDRLELTVTKKNSRASEGIGAMLGSLVGGLD